MSSVQGAQRIVVIGMAGAGKTTMARRLSAVTGLPHVELDGLHWGPDWEPRLPQFRDEVKAAAADDRWVMDGNYSSVREVLWPRAQLVIWLTCRSPPSFAASSCAPCSAHGTGPCCGRATGNRGAVRSSRANRCCGG